MLNTKDEITGKNDFSMNIFLPMVLAATHISMLLNIFIPNPLKKYTSCSAPAKIPITTASFGELTIE